jgi:hypothetical protein
MDDFLDAEFSIIDEQGKDAAGKFILTLISVVSHCLVHSWKIMSMPQPVTATSSLPFSTIYVC